MDSSNPLSHPTVYHKSMLGWADSIKVIEPSTSEYSFETIALHPVADTKTIPPGSFSAVQIRRGHGRNYYVEYRTAMSGLIGDQALPNPDSVLITDTVSYGVPTLVERPWLELGPEDDDGDGPVLQLGADFRAHEHDPRLQFEVRVVDLVAGSHAEVEVDYGKVAAPDLSITPWPAPPFDSPDIWITNAETEADPSRVNQIALGSPNTVHARVRNMGNMDAPGAKVWFYVTEFTVSDGPLDLIGSAIIDVAAGRGAIAEVEWRVPPGDSSELHYCVIVKIEPYIERTSATLEASLDNNEARTNFAKSTSTTASPWKRVARTIHVSNVSLTPETHHIQLHQTNPLYRTYLERRWVALAPGETRAIRVLSEYAGDDFLENGGDPALVDQLRDLENEITLSSHVVSGTNYWSISGGANINVTQGLETAFKDFSAELLGGESIVRGRVQVVSTGNAAPDAPVVLSFDEGSPNLMRTVTTATQSGDFEVLVPPGWTTVRAKYLAPAGYGDAISDLLVP